MSGREIGIFMYLYFVIIPLVFAVLLIGGLIFERIKEYKQRQKLRRLKNEND